MKHIPFLLLLALCFQGFAGAPQAFTYQAIARDSTGNVLQITHLGFRFTIHDGSATGTIVYQETDTVTTDRFGGLSIPVGYGTVIQDSLSGVNWSSGNKYLQVELDASGGTNYANMGTTQFASAPNALFTQTATSLVGRTHYIGDLYQGGIIVAVWDSSGAEHGLIASTSDLSQSVWSNTWSSGIAASPSNGKANTAAIVSAGGITSGAAFVCTAYNGGGYTDWYLPAAYELQECMNAAMIVNKVLGDSNGFQCTVPYWSSTELNGNTSWCEWFCTGYAAFSWANQETTYSVRAVRSY